VAGDTGFTFGLADLLLALGVGVAAGVVEAFIVLVDRGEDVLEDFACEGFAGDAFAREAFTGKIFADVTFAVEAGAFAIPIFLGVFFVVFFGAILAYSLEADSRDFKLKIKLKDV
jgi:hypothetical protein